MFSKEEQKVKDVTLIKAHQITAVIVLSTNILSLILNSSVFSVLVLDSLNFAVDLGADEYWSVCCRP